MKKSLYLSAATAFVVVTSMFVISRPAQAIEQVRTPSASICPAGYTCTLLPPCPEGYVCEPITTIETCPVGYNCQQNGQTVEPTNLACYQFNLNLQVNMSGPDVAALQNFLIASGFAIEGMYDSNVTGFFGLNTKEAVMKYQAAMGIPPTGFVGPLTRAALNTRCGAVSNMMIIPSLDPMTPLSRTIMLAGSSETYNVPLMIFDLKSQGGTSTLQKLVVDVSADGQWKGNSAPNLFSSVSIKINGVVYSASRYSDLDTKVYFDNLSFIMPANQYIQAVILGTVKKNVGNDLDGSRAQAILNSASSTIIAFNLKNQQVPVYRNKVIGNPVNFVSGDSPILSNAVSRLEGPIVDPNGVKMFYRVKFSFNLTPGNVPIMLGKVPKYASSAVFSQKDGSIVPEIMSLVSNGSTSGDSNDYYYIAPGSTRDFTYEGRIMNPFQGDKMFFARMIALLYGTSSRSIQDSTLNIIDPVLQVAVEFNGTTTDPLVLSDAQSKLGNVLTDPKGTIINYPVTFSFRLKAGDIPIFIGKVPKYTGSAVFSQKDGNVVPQMTELTSQGSTAGDSNDTFYMPPGSSRDFTYTGKIWNPNKGNGIYVANMIALLYGKSQSSPQSSTLSIVDPALRVSVQFNGSTTATTTSILPTIKVSSPNGGETYRTGDRVTIRWNAANFGSMNVWLTLADKYGTSVAGNWLNAANIPNTGSYIWVIPNGIVPAGTSGAFRIVARSYDKGPSASDLSDSYFTITRPYESPVATPVSSAAPVINASPVISASPSPSASPYYPVYVSPTPTAVTSPSPVVAPVYSPTPVPYVSPAITAAPTPTPSPSSSPSPVAPSVVTPSPTPSVAPKTSASPSPTPTNSVSSVDQTRLSASIWDAIGEWYRSIGQ